MAKKLPVPPSVDLDALQAVWGLPIDGEHLAQALIHRSYANEAGGIPNNERLEFLGDSVLSIVIAERLYADYPQCTESELSRMRAATVSQEPLAEAARALGLGDYLYLGKGESMSGGREKASILSDTFEALIGATYLTHGFETTRTAILRLLDTQLAHAYVGGQSQDWKTTILEYCRDHGWGEVSYSIEGEGPDHARTFTATVFVEGLEGPQGQARGTSKKNAENMAARDAVLTWNPNFLHYAKGTHTSA